MKVENTRETKEQLENVFRPVDENKIKGSVVASLIGDVVGAYYESGILERASWVLCSRTFSGKKRYTDDSELSLATMDYLLKNNGVNQNKMALDLAKSVNPLRGYGIGMKKTLSQVKRGKDWRVASKSVFPQGSFGNGAAMKSHIFAIAEPDVNQMLVNVKDGSEITHGHQTAIFGAQIIAMCVSLALEKDNSNPESILDDLCSWVTKESKCHKDNEELALKVLGIKELLSEANELNGKVLSKKEIRKKLGSDPTAVNSVATAVFFAFKHYKNSLDIMIKDVCRIGGDTDTIAAMAGSIWGAANGLDSIDSELYSNIENIEVFMSQAERLAAIRRIISLRASLEI